MEEVLEAFSLFVLDTAQSQKNISVFASEFRIFLVVEKKWKKMRSLFKTYYFLCNKKGKHRGKNIEKKRKIALSSLSKTTIQLQKHQFL